MVSFSSASLDFDDVRILTKNFENWFFLEDLPDIDFLNLIENPDQVYQIHNIDGINYQIIDKDGLKLYVIWSLKTLPGLSDITSNMDDYIFLVDIFENDKVVSYQELTTPLKVSLDTVLIVGDTVCS